MYHKNWSRYRVPPRQDDRSSDGLLRYLLAEGTKKSSTPHMPMNTVNEATDKKGYVRGAMRRRKKHTHGRKEEKEKETGRGRGRGRGQAGTLRDRE